jgi:Domain of unknown function (DUF4422)
MDKFQKNEKDIFTLFSAFFYKDFPIPPVSYVHPIHAGKAIADFDLGIEGDDTGDNISSWNKNFSELTVAYYIWKNYDANQLPYWGLCQYRRYFCNHLHWSKIKKEYHFTDREAAFKKIFTDKLYTEIETNLLAGKVISPIPYRFIKLKKWSVKKQYFRDHDEISWNLTEAAIKKLHPQYSSSFSAMGDGLTCSWYNMLIASWSFWDGYLTFLFDILLEVKKELVITENVLQIRIFGNLSERLLNTYLQYHKKNKGLEVHNLPIARIS